MTTATIATTAGDIVVELAEADAPKATSNFVKLAREGFYDGVIFHRVIPGFVIQGGDGEHGRVDDKGEVRRKDRVGQGGPGYRFADEPFTGDYERGALAMPTPAPTPTARSSSSAMPTCGASCRRATRSSGRCSPGWRSSTRSRPRHGTAATSPSGPST